MKKPLLSISLVTISSYLVACSDAPVTTEPDPTDALETQDQFEETAKEVSIVPETSDAQPLDITRRGEFGKPCATNAQCDVGVCTETRDGKVCTKACSETCPNGFRCAPITSSGSDVRLICISRTVRLCDPCKQHSDCNVSESSGNFCVSHGSAGSFCGIACNPLTNDCPKSYQCQQVTDAKTGVSSTQCLPEKGAQCSCSVRATQLGLSTVCQNQNFHGICQGDRTCTVQGLTKCIGQIPDQEACNKIDDNCDGETDNIDPKAVGSACSKTNSFGICQGEFVGCSGGKPVCNALEPAPESCNGKDDDCDQKTDEGLCDDGNECTTDLCNTDGSCKHTKLTGTVCDDKNVCTASEQCASGSCVGGSVLNCDDLDSCTTDYCDPFTGCVHKPASNGVCPDDGVACTQDLCVSGKCSHPNIKDGVVCAEDGNICTKDQCLSGECSHVANSALCDDGNPCTLNDTCKDKACILTIPKKCLDDNPCTVDECDPKIGCVFKPNPAWKDGLPCPDDGNPCTEDVCKGSSCSHLPMQNCN